MKKTIKKTKEIDYLNVVLPAAAQEQSDHSNYSSTERRAEMLRIVLAQGHFDLPVQKMAVLYGVSNGMISQDKDILRRYVSGKYLKPAAVISEAIVAKQKALKECLKSNKWTEVDHIATSILQTCFDLGLVSKAAEQVGGEITVKWKKE
jgi:hypothetical protein